MIDVLKLLRKPLFFAFLLTSALTLILSILLYLNEDLRTSTFVLLEKTLNEEGEEEVRVKIEKPKPNERQVREIARNQERKKEESLEEKAKEIRDAIRKIQETTDVLEMELEEFSEWNQLGRMAKEIQSLIDRVDQNFQSNEHLASLTPLVERLATIGSLGEQINNDIEAFTEADLPPGEQKGLLDDARVLRDKVYDVLVKLDQEVNRLENQPHVTEIRVTRDTLRDLNDVSRRFVNEIERFHSEEASLEMEALAELESALLADLLANGIEGFMLPEDETIEEMEVPELYELIQEMTAYGDEAFAENRAAELAATENISMVEAQEQVYAPETHTGPDLSDSLSNNQPSTLEQFQNYSEALNQAEQAAGNMARTAQNRAQQATGSQSGAASEGQTAQQLQEALRQRAGAMGQMNSLARNQGRAHGNVQDMRGLMMQAYQVDPQGGGGSGEGLDGRVLSHTYQTDLTVSGGTPESQTSETARIDTAKIMREALPGRRLDASAARKGWIFLDTWYIIGPWQRPRVNSFETRFPPEIEVDLDQTYLGKKHPNTKEPLNLEWRFIQTENIRVNPPDELSDSVYYAYTEVFAERAMEVVVAVASDDMAKLWVNDLVVWEDEGLSPWRLDEGFRRILLKAGYNKVLCRIENGPSVCYFSVLFSPIEGLNL